MADDKKSGFYEKAFWALAAALVSGSITFVTTGMNKPSEDWVKDYVAEKHEHESEVLTLRVRQLTEAINRNTNAVAAVTQSNSSFLADTAKMLVRLENWIDARTRADSGDPDGD